MNIKIIAGPSGSGKTTVLQEEIIQTTLTEPDQRVIYIVPEQATLMTQKQLLDRHPRHGILKVEILSFNRLAYRILQEAGKDDVTTLDDMGKSMLLYKVCLDHADELLYYKSSIRKKGFIGQLKIMLTEIYQYRLDASFFDRILSTLEADSTLAAKLHDIRILFTAFEEKTNDNTIPSERLLDLLEEQIPNSQLLDGADIYMDDFYGFTPQQYAVLNVLWKKARKVRLTLPLEKEDAKNTLYAQSEKVLRQLSRMGLGSEIRYLEKPDGEGSLAVLNRHLFDQDRPDGMPYRTESRIGIYKADRPETEVEWVLSHLSRKVREDRLNYKDTAILTGAEDVYLPILERMGRRYHIPIFIDRRADLSTHPAVQMLKNMLIMVQRRYSYESVFAWAKSGYLPFDKTVLDPLENEALKYGWRGRRRYEEGMLALFTEEPEIEQQVASLFEILSRLEQKEATAGEWTDCILSVFQHLHLEEQIAEQAAWLREQGEAGNAAFYEQAYEALLTVLDQMQAVLGEEPLDLSGFEEILMTGIAQSRVGILPPAPDEVQIADTNRSRLTQVKALYVLGFQDDAFPKITEEAGLLSDAERKKLSLYHDVAADRTARIGEQIFYLYNALGKVSESVYFSFSTSDGAGGGKSPSRYIARMTQLFQAEDLYIHEKAIAMHPDWLMDHLAEGLEQGEQEAQAIQWLQDHGERQTLAKILKGREDTLPEERLEEGDLWDLLDLNRRSVSVTQLEQYARCPLSWYMQYGLSLKEREELSIRPLDDGNLLHALLEEAGPALAAMENLSKEEIEQRMDALLDEHAESFQRYKASSRYGYYFAKLKRSAVRAMEALTHQLQNGEFVPEAFEWTFGGADRRTYAIMLPNGKELRLMGKIDRVDILRDGEEEYVRVLDYKSGRTGWDPWELYEGLKLQLPIYLDVWQQHHADKAAGIFYFHLVPLLQKGEEGKGDLADQIQKSMRLDGILLDDPYIAEKMDHDLPIRGNGSIMIPAKLKKDGAFAANSHTVRADQFEALKQLAAQKAAELGEQLDQGHVEAHPVQNKDSLTCSFCPYRSACRLDPARDTERIRRIHHDAKEDFWKAIER